MRNFRKLIPNNLKIGNVIITDDKFNEVILGKDQEKLIEKCIKNKYIKELKDGEVEVIEKNEVPLEIETVEETADDKIPLGPEVFENMDNEEIADAYTMKELKAYAKSIKLPKYTTYNQEDLIAVLKS